MAGVLTFNNVVRERHLQENLGLYGGIDLTTPSYSYYTFNTKPLSVLMGKGGLYEYTHNEETEYSKKIGHLYFKHRPDFQPYINIDPINPQNFWGGEFHDYYDYVNAVYSQITPPIQFIEGLLSTQFLDEAIRVTSPAIVHNPEPILSMAGAIKTNVNNFSGTDTRLGLLGNQMYAHTLYHGANFNTMRKGTASFNGNVITPSVGVRFGNSDYTINSLSNIVSPLRADGRIVEDYNEGIGIIHSLSQITTNTEVVKKDKETRNAETEEYKKLKAKYDGELKKYKQALQDLKDGKITEDQVPQKPVKPQKPSKKTTAEFIANDINFSNLFKTLQFNVQFNKDIFDFESYANTRYYNGHSRSAEEFSVQNQKGKVNGVTQHIVYNDDNVDRFKISDKYGLNNVEVTSEETPDAQFYITEFDNYIPLNNAHGVSNNSLIHKTNEIFNKHKVNTIFGEHTILTDEIKGLGFGNFVDSYYKNSATDSSTTSKGRSRGRNLLKKNEGEVNGIPNPFCRTWTYHHQYDRMDKLIRPLSDEDGNIMTIEETQALNQKYRAWNTLFGQQVPGEKYLAENTVLNNNGLVNIAPSNEGKVDIKKCMFSIENLAWKDVLNLPTYLSKEQRGPNGGRIMWFPPYDLNFSENTNVNWEQSTFIGRGEKVYTYSNTDRTGNLSFTLLIDHPSTIHNIYTEEGNLREGITDEDILRFFAGCAPLESPEEKRPIPIPIPTPDPEPELTSDKTSIYVYFPNNYSGHYNNVINSSAEDTTTPPDNDFVDYMVYGVNAKTLAPSECEWCHGTGLCVGCNGEGTIPCSCGDGLCENCKGSGYTTCDECEGNGKIECPTCKGLGQILKEIDGEKKVVKCPTCLGSCEVLCKTCLGKGEIKCTECNGTGQCSKCGGTGKTVCDFCRQDERLKIKDGPNKGKYMCLHCEGKGYTYPKGDKCTAEGCEQGYIKHQVKYECEVDGCQGGFITTISACTYDGCQGGFVKKQCDVCHGTGEIEKEIEENLEYIVPEIVSHCFTVQDDEFLTLRTTQAIKYIKKQQNSNSSNVGNTNDVNHKGDASFFIKYQKYRISIDAFTTKKIDFNYTTTEKNTFEDQRLENIVKAKTMCPVCQNKKTKCNVCGGKGTIEHDPRKTCPLLVMGYICETTCQEYQENSPFLVKCDGKPYDEKCQNCDGTGSMVYRIHEKCNGTGCESCEGTGIVWCDVCNGTGSASGMRIVSKGKEKDTGKDVLIPTDYRIFDSKQEITFIKTLEKTYLGTENNLERYEIPKGRFLLMVDMSKNKDEYQNDISAYRIIVFSEKESADISQFIKLHPDSLTIDSIQQDNTLSQPEYSIYTDDMEHHEPGTTITRSITKKEASICTKCSGGTITEICPSCKGSGYTITTTQCTCDNGYRYKYEYSACTECSGTGIIPYKILEPRGYEMTSSGLSVTEVSGETTTEGAFLCCTTKPIKIYQYCDPESIGDKYYYYRTDFDLKQGSIGDSNFKDSNSFSLNSLNGDGDFNFSTLVYALKYKTKDSSLESFKEYMKKIINDDTNFNQFIKDGEKLCEILSNSNAISRIVISGSASLQDSKNSQMLAKRRGGTLQHLIEEVFPDLKGRFLIGYHSAGTGHSVNTEDIKKNRYSRIDIEYYTSKTDTFADNQNETVTEKEDLSKKTIITDYAFTRYENEAQYFQKLKTTDPTTFRKLTDKYKYFTPAFHSVSPEGFNARLTFLQQCTRQGHTLEPKFTTNTSDAPTAIAGNLAFGRMPVCVLRIGDFIYSRILITSMSINYGDNQWDLNPEGAGVQPMMAKVNLGITILGGQSLEGPISKLQNAVTFNYYANTGVYDDRADRAKPIGDSNKWSTDYYYTWEPEYSGDSEE